MGGKEGGMTTDAQMRLERIERLLRELTYEITRGVMEREIEPHLQYSKLMPLLGHPSGHTAALLTVILEPSERYSQVQERKPRLRIVDSA
jgi:hypothetical protein